MLKGNLIFKFYPQSLWRVFYFCCQSCTIFERCTLSISFCPASLSPKFPCSDAPKHTNITRAAQQEQPDGKSSVKLSCSSHSYPPVIHYSWYKKTEDTERGIIVSRHQNFTVYSDQPGIYYCIAKNEINQRLSDPVELFVDREWMQCHVSVCVLYIAFIRDGLWNKTFFPSAVWIYATCSQMYLHTDTLFLQTTGGFIKFVFIFLIILLVIVVLFFVYR